MASQRQKNGRGKYGSELPSFKGPCKLARQQSLWLRKSFLPFSLLKDTHTLMHACSTHTAHKAHCTVALGPELWVLDLGWNGPGVYQSAAQPRTRENDAANNIITALVHISLIWQKSSLNGVSHMVHCSVMARTGGGTNGGFLGAFSVRTQGMSYHCAKHKIELYFL